MNNNSKYFKDWSTDHLKAVYKGIYNSYYVLDLKSTHDVSNLIGMCLELEKRGIEINESNNSKIIFSDEMEA